MAPNYLLYLLMTILKEFGFAFLNPKVKLSPNFTNSSYKQKNKISEKVSLLKKKKSYHINFKAFVKNIE